MNYNISYYPWSGRLGRIADCCIYCGTKGSAFQLSSAGSHCLRCRPDKQEPIPELLEAIRQKYETLAREWCNKRNIDYEATLASYEQHLKDKTPGEDHTIYKTS